MDFAPPAALPQSRSDPRDAERIDALIRKFFAAFDNRGGRAVEPAEIVGLFAETAVIARYHDGACDLHTPREFAEPRIALLKGALVEFHEWEETSSTRIAGGIAARVSRYAKSGVFNGSPYAGAGTKFFQLARVAPEWKIVALAWADAEVSAGGGNG